MKKFYTISFCLLAVVAVAQSSSKIKSHRFSFALESGLMTSFIEMPEEVFTCCPLCDCVIPISVPNAINLIPTRITSLYLGASANFNLSRKHQIGLGLIKSEMGEMEPHGESLARKSIGFLGFTARHKYIILSGYRLNLAVSNAISLEKPITETYVELRNGISHTLGLTCGIQITRLMEASISMVGKTSIRGFYGNAFYSDKHRFGGGLFVGLSYSI